MKTRPLMIGDMQQAIRKETCHIVDKETISELMAFMQGPDGKMKAAPGAHDDEVIGVGIAIEMCKLHPYYDLNVNWAKKQFHTTRR